jgi:hypothetical protein
LACWGETLLAAAFCAAWARALAAGACAKPLPDRRKERRIAVANVLELNERRFICMRMFNIFVESEVFYQKNGVN